MTDRLGSTDTQHDEVHNAMELLAAGIPLTLLLDLATPVHSAELYTLEAGAADWLCAGVA
jgi:hypothetical protein